MTSAVRAPENQPPAQNLTLEEQIRQRAYEIYLERGEGPGCEIEDWLQAENEIAREIREH